MRPAVLLVCALAGLCSASLDKYIDKSLPLSENFLEKEDFFLVTEAVRCYVCKDAVSNTECQATGRIKTCSLGEICLNEVRREDGTIRITKRCKQPLACRNNMIQNTYGPIYQCNHRVPRFVCRCCCDTDQCNAASLFCIDGYPDDSVSDEPLEEDMAEALTVVDISLLRDSWSQLTLAGLDTIGLLLLRRLFNEQPQTRALFSNLDIADKPVLSFYDLLGNPKVVLHSEIFATALDTIVGLLEEPEELTLYLTWLGSRHAALGVAPVNLDFMESVILDTFQDILEVRRNSKFIRVWTKAYRSFKREIVAGIEMYYESQ